MRLALELGASTVPLTCTTTKSKCQSVSYTTNKFRNKKKIIRKQ